MKHLLFLPAILLFMLNVQAESSALPDGHAFSPGPDDERLFWSAYARGDYESASEAAEKLSDSIPEYLFLSAVCDFNLRRYASFREKSERYHMFVRMEYNPLRVLLEKHYNRNKFEINNLMGIVQYMISRAGLGSAREFFEKSVALEDFNPVGYNFLALTLLQEGNIQEAIKMARIAISLDEEYPEPYTALAFAWNSLGDEQKAMDFLLESMVKCPVNPEETYSNFVMLTCEYVTPPSAEAAMGIPVFKTEAYRDHTLSRLKGRNLTLYELAYIFFLSQSYAEADTILAAISPDPGIMGRYYYLYCVNAFSLGDTARFQEGLAHLDSINEAAALVDMGTWFSNSRNFKMAAEVLRLAESMPASGETALRVLSNLGIVEAKLGNDKEAIRYFKKALKLDSEDVLTLINMGNAFHRLGKNRRAVKYLEKAREYSGSEREKAVVDHWLKEVEKG